MKISHVAIIVVAMAGMAATSCKSKAPKRDNAPVTVETIAVVSSSTDGTHTYSGIIEESSGTALSFKVPGTIKKIYVSEGQHVAAGQAIASLGDATLKNNLEIAKSALNTAQDTYNRMKLLHASGSITDMKWVEVENALAAAKSSHKIAEDAVADATIFAPFGGIISEKIADAGATVAPAIPVVKLIQMSPVKASISMSGSEISSVPEGATALVTVDAIPGFSVEAKLSEKGVAADPLSRTYDAKFLIPNPDGKLLPGMLCTVALKGVSSSDAMVVPVEAVQLAFDNSHYLWTVSGGVAVRKSVTLGAYTTSGVTIASGLEPGDSVICRGQQKVSEGMKVIANAYK